MDKSKWEYKKLGEIGEIITGGTPPTKDPRNYSSDDYCFVKPSDLTDEKVMMLDESEFHVSSYAYSNSRKLPKGSVLVCCIGSIGKLGILNVDATCNQQINAIIPKEGFDSRYLAYTLLASKHNLLNIANAPVVPIINKSQFSNIKIKVCPRQDQQRIVAELDCLNEMIALKQEQLKEFDKLAQSIFYDMFGDPVDNEKGWDINRLEENVTLINGRAYKQDELLSDGKYKVIRVGNFFSNSTYYYSDLELENDKYCEAGDLLYTWSASFGARIWEGEKVIYHYHIWKVNYDVKRYNKLFLCYLLNVLTEKFKENVHGVTMVHLTKAGMEKTEIPLPPLALQQQFAEKIQAIEAQKELVKQSISETQFLFNSRMDFYFN